MGLQAVLETCGIESNGLYDVKQEVEVVEEAGATIHIKQEVKAMEEARATKHVKQEVEAVEEAGVTIHVKQEVEAMEEAGATIHVSGGQGCERPEQQYMKMNLRMQFLRPANGR